MPRGNHVEWIRVGEAALARLQIDEAQKAFEQAAALAHSADAELGLTRSYLQAGEFRRALAFVAHTAAAHSVDTGGTALYVWLLNAAGRSEQAKRILQDALQRSPSDLLLGRIASQLSSAIPLASASMLRPPARLAPYSEDTAKGARITGNGVLIGSGEFALVTGQLLNRRSRVWVRNGLGEVHKVNPVRRIGSSQLWLVKRMQIQNRPNPIRASVKPPFPGSVAHIVNFLPASELQPQWPQMHSGFLGAVRSDQTRTLGIELPFQSQGAPVFDASGALTGVSTVDRAGQQSLLACAELLPLEFWADEPARSTQSTTKIASDAVYEIALRVTLQTIAL